VQFVVFCPRSVSICHCREELNMDAKIKSERENHANIDTGQDPVYKKKVTK